jgi:putative inorganic carbon (HCO3(-)) transporter
VLDWVRIVENATWVTGLAAVLAGLSWASWSASCSGTGLIDSVFSSGLWLCLSLGLTFSSAGLLLGGHSTAGYATLGLLLSLLAARMLVARRERAVPSPQPISALPCEQKASHRLLRAAAAWAAKMEPGLLLALTPLLMFPNRLTPMLAPLLVLPWLGRRLDRGQSSARTPMDWAVWAMLAMLPVSLWVSPDVHRSLPKFYGILLGIAVYHGVANFVRSERQAWIVAALLGFAGPAVALLALAGTDWRVYKFPALSTVYQSLPRLVSRLPGLPQGGLNPNEVGAALSLFIPFGASLVLLAFSSPQGTVLKRSVPPTNALLLGRRRWVLLVLLLWAVVLMAATLLLSQSRSALVGVSVALLALAVLERRWLYQALALGLLGGALVWRRMGSEGILLGILQPPGLRPSRTEIWLRALQMIQDSLITGVGLNCFPVVAIASYPFVGVSQEEVLRLTHAHNAFLQVAVDLGVPGLVAYLALLMAFGAAWWVSYQRFAHSPLRAVSSGLFCGMLAYHVYGITDCITLGAKPGLFIWLMLGLMAALANLSLPR